MKLKSVFQIILVLTIVLIIVAFYYTFLIQKNTDDSITSSKESKKENVKLDNQISNELVNIEYNSTDSEGNTFYINAERAIVNLEDQKNNQVRLEGIVSIIYLKNKGTINIYSNNAIYDKVNHDTLFYNNVKVEYLDNSILAENLDIKFTKKMSRIYNNVIYKNNNFNLNTDQILIDMKSGDIKLKMMDEGNKVRLISKYEFIN